METCMPISFGSGIHLHGLESQLDVLSFRNAIINGTLKPYTDKKVKSTLKLVAVTVHDQMCLSPDLRIRIRRGESPVAWFLSAVHRIIPPRPSQTSLPGSVYPPLEYLSSMPPWYKDVEPSSSETEDECKLPEFDDEDMLPLCHWEGLYYALVAEVYVFYFDTETRYPNSLMKENIVLHQEGFDGHNRTPVKVVQLMKVLENCWDMLMNPLLTTALDYAVKQHAAWLDTGDIPTIEEALMEKGLVNINPLSWGHIMRMLVEEYAQNVKIAVRSNVVDVAFMLNLKEDMEIRSAESLEAEEQTEDPESSAESPITPRRKPVPTTHPSFNDQRDFQNPIHPALRESKLSSPPPRMPYLTAPETLPSAHLHESFQSMQNRALYQTSFSSTNESVQRFPSFDSTRALPALPSRAKAEGFDLQDTDDLPTLRRTRVADRPATSPSTPPPDRMVVPLRSNTAPTGQAPFALPDPIPFGLPSNPINPVPREKQRYVSAGGQKPLHEREVMHDYSLPAVESEGNKTYSAKKEDLWAQIDEKQQAENASRVGKAKKSNASRESGSTKGVLKRMFSRSQSETH